jgi:hypothetical protein
MTEQTQKERRENIGKTVQLLTFLLWESFAFVLLPLFVYLLVFVGLGINPQELFKLPEWMFISVILYGDISRKQIAYYQVFKGFDLRIIRTISVTVFGIVISSTFLIFSVIAQYNSSFHLSGLYYISQIVWFIITLAYSILTSMWISRKKGEDELLTYLIPEMRENLPAKEVNTKTSRQRSKKGNNESTK